MNIKDADAPLMQDPMEPKFSILRFFVFLDFMFYMVTSKVLNISSTLKCTRNIPVLRECLCD